MKAIIIAAGSATRLGELTKKIPKGLLKINGKSIIELQLEQFRSNNVLDIIIITGPNHEQFNFSGISLMNDKKFHEHDVLGSLMTAKLEMNDELITSYSDIVFDNSILNSVLNFQGDLGIAIDLNWEKRYLDRTDHPRSEADNVVIENNKIIKIKKNILEYTNSQQMGEFLGLMKLSKHGAEIFVKKYNALLDTHEGRFQNAPSLTKAYLTDMLQELIDSGVDIHPIFIDGEWHEIDTSQDLDQVKKKRNKSKD